MSLVSTLNLPTEKESQLKSKNIETTRDLMLFFPRRYIDMRKGKLLDGVQDGEVCAVDGKVVYKSCTGLYPVVDIKDAQGDTLEITWFGNSTYYYEKFQMGKTYRVAGRITLRRNEYKMGNPTIFYEVGSGEECIYPIYPKIKGMSESYLRKCIAKAISIEEKHMVPDRKTLTAANLNLMDYFSAVRNMHDPIDERHFRGARTRMSYEILYDFYAGMQDKRKPISIREDLDMDQSEYVNKFIQSLPFELTEGQSEAVDYVLNEAKAKHRIDTLITGDVGCGKTMVAEIAAIMAWENGFQSIIMAPTLVLAKQHFEEMTSRIPGDWEKAPQFALLTSETKKRERTKILKGLLSGEISILIGTSSVLSDELEFSNLGLTVIDEEHKYGAEQKAILEKKQRSGIHHIAMTATPIPRSLARTIYGDNFNVQAIQTMPKGRKPVITKQSSDRKEMFEALAEQVKLGHQAYVICPFIQDSESEKFQDVDSVESVVEELNKYFGRTHPSIRVDSISGKMKQSGVLKKINEFAAKNIDILVSTTIVEVGVNVPNATAILIMSSDRFGLAALHQLRGRVGRGGDQAYCFLSTSHFSDKLDILCHTTNGFKIAEEDMKLRGPGNLTGEAQTGYSEAIEQIVKRPKLAAMVRAAVFAE